MTKVLVTGAAGFIGSHLCEALVARGHKVVGLDAFLPNYDPAIKRQHLRDLSGSPGFELVDQDLCDGPALSRLLADRGFDAVVHLAALPGVVPSLKHPHEYFEVNVLGTSALLEGCRTAGVGRVVLASSSSVYGNATRVPLSEEETPAAPVSPYGHSKLAMEQVARAYHQLGLEHLALLRLFTVYGPRQRPEMAIHRFTRRILRGEELTLYDAASSERDYTFVEDIVDGLIRVLERGQGLVTLNLGNNRPVSLETLVATLGRILGVEPRVRHEPARHGDVHRTWADLTRARETVGYAPRVDLEEGLERFVTWYREQREFLEPLVPVD